jgi:hypothetical protein
MPRRRDHRINRLDLTDEAIDAFEQFAERGCSARDVEEFLAPFRQKLKAMSDVELMRAYDDAQDLRIEEDVRSRIFLSRVEAAYYWQANIELHLLDRGFELSGDSIIPRGLRMQGWDGK